MEFLILIRITAKSEVLVTLTEADLACEGVADVQTKWREDRRSSNY